MSNPQSMYSVAQSRLQIIKKPVLSFIFLCIILYVVYEIYIHFIKHKITGNKYIVLSKKSTLEPILVPDSEIEKPLDEYSFTLFLTMNIDDYYKNMGVWKHVFHKGTKSVALEEETIEKDKANNWSLINAKYSTMCPGIWLHPTDNTLRLVLDVLQLEEYNASNHPDQITNLSELEHAKIRKTGFPMIKQEIIDIPNIPIHRQFTLIVEVDRNSVSIRINGEYVLFKTLPGLVRNNNGPMEVHKKHTYSGSIVEYSFVPFIVSKDNLKNFLP